MPHAKLKLIVPVLLAPIANAQCPVSFAPAATYPVGGNPRTLAAGDLNADGIADLAVANNTGNRDGSVSLLMGVGDGSFEATTSLATGRGPVGLAIGDLDRDGRPDIVVTNSAAHSIQAYLNTSAGGGPATFSSPYGWNSAGYFPHSLAIADFNSDGWDDLAITNNGGVWTQGANVAVFLSTTNGAGSISFAPATTYAAGELPNFAAAADLNGDGNRDLAVANGAAPNLSLLFGSGAGGFGPATPLPVGDLQFTVQIADLNADGIPDLAVPTQSRAVALSNDGTGGFGTSGLYPVGIYPRMLAIGDLNGDGAPDLATANSISSDVSVLLNTGSGSFGAATNFPVGSYPIFMAMADFNGDGTTDLAVSNNYENSVSILLNTSPCQLDHDSDGLSDVDEIAIGTDPHNPDTDGDDLFDGTEVGMAAGSGCPNPLNADSDADTLPDGFEVALGTMPCSTDSDGDLVPDQIDPDPTVPAGTQGVLEQILRAMADGVEGLGLDLFDARIDNARMGHRNATANKLRAAANAVAAGNLMGAIDALESLLQKLDGDPNPPDWMLEGPEKAAIRYDIGLVIVIIQQL